MTLDRGHKSCFLTADECTCAESDLDIEIKACAEDVLAEKSSFSCLLKSYGESVNGNRILCTNVNEALVCADSVSGDSHSLDDSVRVALEDRSVHECARVALVGVTSDILYIAL